MAEEPTAVPKPHLPPALPPVTKRSFILDDIELMAVSHVERMGRDFEEARKKLVLAFAKKHGVPEDWALTVNGATGFFEAPKPAPGAAPPAGPPVGGAFPPEG